MKTTRIVCLCALMCLLFAQGCCRKAEQQTNAQEVNTTTWQQEFTRQLPLLGHRNWVLVTDKAFPLQSSGGMRYINTGEELLNVAGQVLSAIEGAPHVKAIIYTDQELRYLNNELAPGAEDFRTDLYRLLEPYDVQTLCHEEIFARLDEASRLFNVVVLKTEGVLPYTSLFIELDCGYWSAEKESALRGAMKQ